MKKGKGVKKGWMGKVNKEFKSLFIAIFKILYACATGF